MKRVYEPATDTDGLRVLVDKLWPRGIRKEALTLRPVWRREIAPIRSPPEMVPCRPARPLGRVPQTVSARTGGVARREGVRRKDRKEPRATLLYASKNAEENHARVLREYLERESG
ncbi:DUF488 domain-containing protein [Alistipes putredinis]|uniref:DUF488 domain-containing protein n=1 Tax=Alistipes putredinis TaxID=28117 RepID=UPI003995BA1E